MSRGQKLASKGKQILLWGLVALVITAGYYRWTVEADRTDVVPVTGEALPENAKTDEETAESGTSQGIRELRQNRDVARGEAIEQWQKTLQNRDASQEAKQEAEQKVKAANTWSEQEKSVENLVKAKGYTDCFAQINENGISVVVSGGEINGAKVAQMKDIIITETDIPVKKIKISAESL